MNRTSIEWTHRPETRGAAGGMTWNPIRARIMPEFEGEMEPTKRWVKTGKFIGTFCTRISPGCTHCYASTINKRFGNGLEFTVPNLEKIEFFIDERILEEPLKQQKPCTIFVGDMFDLFHESIPYNLIARVIWAISQCPQHTFQLLTKRAARMRELCKVPVKNVWLGVSVEDQQRADERIPLLLQTPAAVRFLSVEPQLEAVDIEHYLAMTCRKWDTDPINPAGCDGQHCKGRKIDWVICGGESGPGARPFNLAWAESLLAQCRAANVPFFMKQVGSQPHWHKDFKQFPEDRKGGDPAEWPEALRVREFPLAQSKEVVCA